jgi:hypothetical protein
MEIFSEKRRTILLLLGEKAGMREVSTVHSGRIWFWTVGGRAQAPRHLVSGQFPLSRRDERRAKIFFAMDVWGNRKRCDFSRQNFYEAQIKIVKRKQVTPVLHAKPTAAPAK